MATYQPAVYPQRPKHSNIFTELDYQIKAFYYQYEITTATYLMSPGEKLAYNLFVLSLLGLVLYASTCLLQGHLTTLRRLSYYITGRYEMPIHHVLRTIDLDAATSVKEVVTVNNTTGAHLIF